MKHVVIDEGSSQIKTCWIDGSIKELIIPSRIVPESRLTNDGKFQDGAYKVGADEYTVAANFDDSLPTNTRQYQTSVFNRILVHESLRLAGFGGEDVTIYTTLPIADFFGVKPINKALIDEKKKNLMGPVESMEGHKLANIVGVRVWPEAIPAWLDLLIDENGQHTLEVDEAYKILIVDIGGTTTDMTVIDGKGNLQKFDSLRKGVFNVAAALKDDLKITTGRTKIENHQIDKALKDKIFAGNSIVENIKKACHHVENEIYYKMLDFASESSNLDAVVYVGGGSALMAERIAKQYKGKTVIGSDLTIARGILKQLISSGTVGA